MTATLRWGALIRTATTMAMTVTALTVTTAVAQSSRPRIDLRCEALATGPTLDCLVTVAARDGRPLDGAQVTIGATMPSMPMAHNVAPVRAAATGRPGEYRGAIELEMSGVWAMQVDLVAGALRDRAVVRLQADECPESRKRCAVPAAGKP